MGVAHDRSAALDLALEFTDAPEELVVELVLREQFLRLTCERALKRGQFLRESSNGGLRRVNRSRFQLLNAVGEAVNEANKRVNALGVEPVDMSLAE